MLLIIEELVLNIISPNAPTKTNIEVEMIYELKTGCGTAMINHHGPAIDVATSGNNMSQKLIKGFTSKLETHPSTAEEFNQEMAVSFNV